MLLGKEVGLGPGHIVLDGDPAHQWGPNHFVCLSACHSVHVNASTNKLLTRTQHVQYSTVLYSTVQYSTVQYCTVLYCTVQYCTVLYSTVLYSTCVLTLSTIDHLPFSTQYCIYDGPRTIDEKNVPQKIKKNVKNVTNVTKI